MWMNMVGSELKDYLASYLNDVTDTVRDNVGHGS